MRSAVDAFYPGSSPGVGIGALCSLIDTIISLVYNYIVIIILSWCILLFGIYIVRLIYFFYGGKTVDSIQSEIRKKRYFES